VPVARLELRRVVKGDDAFDRPAHCCGERIRSGEVIYFRAHAVYPVRIHKLCAERADERAEPDLVEYPTVRAARLDVRGLLPDHRVGVRLRGR
jgi:hypothetical protein